MSGFVGYMLLGFWFRKFARPRSWQGTLGMVLPLWAAGLCGVALPFLLRIPDATGWPVKGPYALAVDLEMSWEFCSTGVLMTVLAYFLILRKMNATGWFYTRVIRPLSEASYGIYLIHILILVELAPVFKSRLATPLAIVALAAATFAGSALVSLIGRRLPKFGRWLFG